MADITSFFLNSYGWLSFMRNSLNYATIRTVKRIILYYKVIGDNTFKNECNIFEDT